MKIIVDNITPTEPGALDIHLQVQDLRSGQEAAVASAFAAIRVALEGDGKISLFEALTIGLALSTMAR